MQFDWDDANVEHIAAHDVEPEEAEQIFEDPRRARLSVYSTPGERRWGWVGATVHGRVLAVINTRRLGAIRVVTARDATLRERRRYRR